MNQEKIYSVLSTFQEADREHIARVGRIFSDISNISESNSDPRRIIDDITRCLSSATVDILALGIAKQAAWLQLLGELGYGETTLTN